MFRIFEKMIKQSPPMRLPLEVPGLKFTADVVNHHDTLLVWCDTVFGGEQALPDVKGGLEMVSSCPSSLTNSTSISTKCDYVCLYKKDKL